LITLPGRQRQGICHCQFIPGFVGCHRISSPEEIQVPCCRKMNSGGSGTAEMRGANNGPDIAAYYMLQTYLTEVEEYSADNSLAFLTAMRASYKILAPMQKILTRHLLPRHSLRVSFPHVAY